MNMSNFTNSEQGDKIRKEFDVWTEASMPEYRYLNEDEVALMYKHFKGHSFATFIDQNGYIFLGGGEADEDDPIGGRFYITEEDLKTLI